MIYASNLITILIQALFFLILSIIFCVFSPFGISFIIFSIIRGKTKNTTLRQVSLVFQIILAVLTFIIGILISLLFSIGGMPFYIYSSGWMITLAVIIGVGFVVAIEVGVIIWETHWLNKKEISLTLRRR